MHNVMDKLQIYNFHSDHSAIYHVVGLADLL